MPWKRSKYLKINTNAKPRVPCIHGRGSRVSRCVSVCSVSIENIGAAEHVAAVVTANQSIYFSTRCLFLNQRYVRADRADIREGGQGRGLLSVQGTRLKVCQ